MGPIPAAGHRRRGPRAEGALSEDRGSVTAEFAIVLPAVLVVLALVVGAILLATQRLALTSAAAEVSRLEARGDAHLAALRLEQLGEGVNVERANREALHCVTLRSAPAGGMLGLIQVSARGCAAVSEARP